MGATCQSAKASGATRLVGSSGGNAGMAMAFAAKGHTINVVTTMDILKGRLH